MPSATSTQPRTHRSILRNPSIPRGSLRIATIHTGGPTTDVTTSPNAPAQPEPVDVQPFLQDLPIRDSANAPIPSPSFPPPPPPNTPTTTRGVRFAAEPRDRPSKRRAKRALRALPYNGALRPKARRVSEADDAHEFNALAVVERAVRRNRRASATERERAALEALQEWGPEVWHREGWEGNFEELEDDWTARGRRWGRRRQFEVDL